MNLNQGDQHLLKKILLKIGVFSLFPSSFQLVYGFGWQESQNHAHLAAGNGFRTFHESTPRGFSDHPWRPSDWQWPVTGDALVEVASGGEWTLQPGGEWRHTLLP